MAKSCKIPRLSQSFNEHHQLTMDESEIDHSDLNNNSISNNQIDALTIDKLNDYAMFELFNHLSIKDMLSVRLMNKRFYFLVENYLSKLDQVMLHVEPQYRLYDSCLEHKQTEFNSIHGVDSLDPFLNKFLIKLPKLKVLSLSFLTINESDLVALTNLQCVGSTLKHLEISQCEFKSFFLNAQTVYDAFFSKLGDKLEHFIFYRNTSYLMPFTYLLKAINKHLINLNSLVLDLMQFEKFNISNEYLKSCSNLKHLSLHGFYCLNPVPKLDKFIARMVVEGKRIEYLNLRCFNLDQNKLFYIIYNCTNLKVLKFSYDFDDDNRMGRQLITDPSVFNITYFQQYMQELREKGVTVNQFVLASNIVALRELEELHLNEIISGDVNIDPFILFLYHNYKQNNLRKLVIANYEIHLMNLKALCYVSRKLEVLSLNDLNDCCYTKHVYSPSDRLYRTVNNSFANTLSYLNELTTLSLNQCNFDTEVLKSILVKCSPKVVNFSFLRCRLFKSNVIDQFIIYANSNPDQMITVLLDEDLVQKIENDFGNLFNLSPPNLSVIPC